MKEEILGRIKRNYISLQVFFMYLDNLLFLKKKLKFYKIRYFQNNFFYLGKNDLYSKTM